MDRPLMAEVWPKQPMCGITGGLCSVELFFLSGGCAQASPKIFEAFCRGVHVKPQAMRGVSVATISTSFTWIGFNEIRQGDSQLHERIPKRLQDITRPGERMEMHVTGHRRFTFMWTVEWLETVLDHKGQFMPRTPESTVEVRDTIPISSQHASNALSPCQRALSVLHRGCPVG